MFAVVITFAIALMLTVAIGVPVASRAAQVHVWKRTALPDMPGDRAAFIPNQFTPVDFGPVKMRWPSEVKRTSKAMPLPDWPSASWEDDHFGRRAPKERPQAEWPSATRESATPPPETNQREAREAVRQAKQDADEARRHAQRQAEAQERAEAQNEVDAQQRAAAARNRSQQRPPQKKKPRRRTAPPAAAEKPAPKTAAKPPAQNRSAGRGDLPGADEVERMVAELGLAGTVQHLMKTQGWDFKTAAGWLGRARRR